MKKKNEPESLITIIILITREILVWEEIFICQATTFIAWKTEKNVVIIFIRCNWEQIMLKFMPASYANLKVIIIYGLSYLERYCACPIKCTEWFIWIFLSDNLNMFTWKIENSSADVISIWSMNWIEVRASIVLLIYCFYIYYITGYFCRYKLNQTSF